VDTEAATGPTVKKKSSMKTGLEGDYMLTKANNALIGLV
jgi:hypothetical protein